MWKIEKLELTLKVNWKLSRNETQKKENFLITYREGEEFFQGEVAPNIHYGETSSRIQQEFKEFCSHKELAKVCPSLRAALNSILLKKQAFQEKKTIGELLKVSPLSRVKTFFSLPIMPPNEVKTYLKDHPQFHQYKIKVSHESADDLLAAYFQVSQKPLLVDGNEAWESPDKFLNFTKRWQGYPLMVIEQPLSAQDQEACSYLKGKCPFPLMADESLSGEFDWKFLVQSFDAVNIKVMKAGGLKESLSLQKEAQGFGLKSMLGCMIETTMSLSDAFQISSCFDWLDLDGFLLLEKTHFNYLVKKTGTFTTLHVFATKGNRTPE